MTKTSGSVIQLREQQAHSNSFTYPHIKISTEDKPCKEPTKNSKHILILGAGVSGLMTAWMLLDKGYRVTIIADDWAWSRDFNKSRMTSQIAGALWEYPPGGCGLTEIESVGPGWANIGHYREWATQSFDFYNRYDKVCNTFEKKGHSFGLQMTKLHQFFYNDVTSGGKDDESTKLQSLKEVAEQHPEFGLDIETYRHKGIKETFHNINSNIDNQDLESAYTHRTPIINTDKAMAYLMALVTVKGATLETRKLEGKIKDFGADLLTDHKAHLIVNATGLGARELADDDDVYPVRGAVKRVDNTRSGHFRHLNDSYLVPAQKNNKDHPVKTIFIVPRNDDVLYVGSIIQPNIYDKVLTPDSPEVQIMWDRAGQFMPSLFHANMVPMYPFAQGLRPFTKRNAKVRADKEAKFRLVHNYGHGGSGWTLGVGTARCVVYIVERLLSAKDEDVQKAAADINRTIYGDEKQAKL
ncbi:FAD dependent oxidoreductase [Linnemannia elongata]|nr:FAD dependent oxidoreductase [Linnemannia elongata]